MLYEHPGAETLDYRLCHYGHSKLAFRGPSRPLPREYVCFVGGTETFGKFVSRPFPALVENMTALASLNLGSANAGLDSFTQDPTVIAKARNARLVVLQLMGPQYLSNRFYTVHPRRNDRFLKANAPLRRLYPSVDFTEFAFVGHLLSRLRKVSKESYHQVREELQTVWTERMTMALQLFGRPVLLLWLERDADHPDLLSHDVVAGLKSDRATLVRIAPDQGEAAQAPAEGCPGAAYHRRVARRLAPFVLNMLDAQGRAEGGKANNDCTKG